MMSNSLRGACAEALGWKGAPLPIAETCSMLMTTADVPPLEGTIGQPRALDAIAFGLEINSPGYLCCRPSGIRP